MREYDRGKSVGKMEKNTKAHVRGKVNKRKRKKERRERGKQEEDNKRSKGAA